MIRKKILQIILKYNAAYLSNFIISKNPQLALNEASKIGAKIVMQKGAIVNVK